MSSAQQPLLGERRIGFSRREYSSVSDGEPRITRWRRSARDFLTSRWGHYIILFLVTVDVCCSFSDFLIQLHICELKQSRFGVDKGWETTQKALGIAGLVIACLFMVELIVSVLSFGKGYFSDYFHIFDSIVILVAFTIEVSVRGIGEELGSLVVVLRLWRVFQIIEELSSAGEDTLEQYEEEIKRLQQENDGLRQRLSLPSERVEGA
ncbi:hypothetical protein N7478_006448 [Penicillium angulare]|uniref:uncharacterized protein n=1 Tax=Penicillium angulare TaxID=116970 RepID=UPI00254263D7|nr:uncharacterized protein N7478_006448 [Penicillium angulare]KAJ5281076.1 hypothetical protein N7478_006448 [Penicillium angulare]